MTALGLDEISTFDKGKVVKIFFGFTMLTQKNVQFNLSRLLLYLLFIYYYLLHLENSIISWPAPEQARRSNLDPGILS